MMKIQIKLEGQKIAKSYNYRGNQLPLKGQTVVIRDKANVPVTVYLNDVQHINRQFIYSGKLM